VVVINKIDRSDARPQEVLNEVYDLFIDLDAVEAQLEFPVLYTNAKTGTATLDPAVPGEDLRPLFDALLAHIPDPGGDPAGVLQLLIANLDYSDYLGRLGIGRIFAGRVKVGDDVTAARRDGTFGANRVTKLYAFDGLKRAEVDGADCGEIVALAGFEGISIGETVTSAADEAPSPPTSTSRRSPRSSPSTPRPSPDAGRWVIPEHQDHLERSCSQRPIRVEPTDSADAFKVMGRGQLQLAS
jgi:GTP-binding protein